MKGLQPLSNRMEAAKGSSLAQVKTAQLAREEEERNRLKRVRGLLVLMEQFLLDQGYVQALAALQQESGVSLQQFTPADNMDLLTVLNEFEQFYEFKFQRKPKLFRTRSGDDDGSQVTVATTVTGEKTLVRKHKNAGLSAQTQTLVQQGNHAYAREGRGEEAPATAPKHLRPAGNISRALTSSLSSGVPVDAGGEGSSSNPLNGAVKRKLRVGSEEGDRALDGLNLSGQKINMLAGATRAGQDADGDHDETTPYEFYNGRALKPLPVFPTSELNDLAATIMRDILDVNPAIRWSDIAELDKAKHLLKEAVVMPVKYPELFEGILRPWKGILLFGPPGTGKTLLAKAVATECRTTFFNISASSVVSKWRGDSEKLVRMLFDLAVHYAPSTIFIDEVDSLMSARSSEGEHEGSRRMKTELLSQMDGLSKRKGGEVVFVLAASNTPWDLDTAMLRRLEKRVLVSLPTAHARELMFRRLLRRNTNGSNNSPGEEAAPTLMDWKACAELTEGMSGADIDIVCREAMMRPIRKLIERLEAAQHLKDGADRDGLAQERLAPPQVTLADVEASVACTRGSVGPEDLKRYDDWMAKFGSGMST